MKVYTIMVDIERVLSLSLAIEKVAKVTLAKLNISDVNILSQMLNIPVIL